MMRTDGSDGGTAFPSKFSSNAPGLSKREWLAGMALSGILANCDQHGENTWAPVDAAKKAVKAADATLEELNK